MISVSVNVRCDYLALVYIWNRLYSTKSKTKYSSEFAKITYFNFIKLGWSSFRRDFISLSIKHSSSVLYFSFIFLIATVSSSALKASKTIPNVPSPNVLFILYFYILIYSHISYINLSNFNISDLIIFILLNKFVSSFSIQAVLFWDVLVLFYYALCFCVSLFL